MFSVGSDYYYYGYFIFIIIISVIITPLFNIDFVFMIVIIFVFSLFSLWIIAYFLCNVLFPLIHLLVNYIDVLGQDAYKS